MAITVQQLFGPVVLATAPSYTVIYSMPTTPTTYTLKNGRIRLTNTSGTTVAVGLWAGPAATASTVANCFLMPYALGPSESLEVDIPTLTAGDTLRGQGANVTAFEMGGVLHYT